MPALTTFAGASARNFGFTTTTIRLPNGAYAYQVTPSSGSMQLNDACSTGSDIYVSGWSPSGSVGLYGNMSSTVSMLQLSTTSFLYSIAYQPNNAQFLLTGRLAANGFFIFLNSSFSQIEQRSINYSGPLTKASPYSTSEFVVGGHQGSLLSGLVARINATGSFFNFASRLLPTSGYIAVNEVIASGSGSDIYAIGFTTPGGAWLAQFSSTGSLNWMRSFSALSEAISVVSDSSGNVYGSFSSSSDGVCIIKFDSSGNVSWQRQLSNTISQSSAIALDSSSNVYVVSDQGILIKLNSSGTTLWKKGFTLGSFQQARAISVNSAGTFVTVFGDNGTLAQSFSMPTDGTGNGSYTKDGLTFSYSDSSVTVNTPSHSVSSTSFFTVDPITLTASTSSLSASSYGTTVTSV